MRPCTLNDTVGRIRKATGGGESVPKKQRKVVLFQEKGEVLEGYLRLWSGAVVAAHHLKINESSKITLVKKRKRIHEAPAAATSAGQKTLHVLRNAFLLTTSY